jgi:hypothetical protein
VACSPRRTSPAASRKGVHALVDFGREGGLDITTMDCLVRTLPFGFSYDCLPLVGFLYLVT